jgi:hypothetical protein
MLSVTELYSRFRNHGARCEERFRAKLGRPLAVREFRHYHVERVFDREWDACLARSISPG